MGRHPGGRPGDLSVAAYDEGSCIGTEGAELTTSELAELEPLLAPAVEANPLPTLENR